MLSFNDGIESHSAEESKGAERIDRIVGNEKMSALHPPNAAMMLGVRSASRSYKYSNSIPNPNQSGKKSHRISQHKLYRQCP